MTAAEYAQNLEANLTDLLERYEQDFLPCSYGFRPGRSAHQALQALHTGFMSHGLRWVIDPDIENYFDSISHSHLRAFLDRRVTDGVIRRMIDKWLKAGVLRELQAAAAVLGVRLLLFNASSPLEIEASFGNLVAQRPGAFLLGTDPFFITERDQLVALVNRHTLPAIFPFREDVAAGGLASYGASNRDAFRLIGGYTGRILSGTEPADLPVQQVTRLELVINLKTAKALGLTVPATLLARADEVIE